MDLYNLVVSAKLQKGGGGGGDVTVEELNVTSNGSYSASSGYAYSPVNVSVPGIVPSGTSAITANGIYDVTNFASASVSVPIPSGYIQPTGTSSITSNGIYDITSFASVDVNVSGGGGGGDHDAEDSIIARTISGAYENSRVTAIGRHAFANCSSLTSVNFPNVTTIQSHAFFNCKELNTISFPNAASISGSAFYGCSSLMSAYFLRSITTYLGSADAFTNTPMSNSTYTGSFGSIYVPASLVSTYKTKTYWSKYADRITSYVE